MKGFWENDQDEPIDDFEGARQRMLCRLSRLGSNRVWLACSGGLDSMVLMHTLKTLCGEGLTQKLGVLHVNYRLRMEEADLDEEFVTQQCAASDVTLKVLRVDPTEHPPGLKGVQEWARDLRYRWFASQVEAGDLIALAHHADDLAETILMRIARGAHLGQIWGMEELKEGIWRPFLQLSRATIEQEAERQKIPHRCDSSNDKLNYSRNRVRHIILPELEAMYPGVRRSLLDLAADARAFVRYSEGTQIEGGVLNAVQLANLSPAVARQKVAAFLSGQREGRQLARRSLNLLLLALRQEQDMTLDLSTRDRAVVKAGTLRIERSEERSSARWQQYRRVLVDSTVRSWLPRSATFERLDLLEEQTWLVDNEKTRSRSADNSC